MSTEVRRGRRAAAPGVVTRSSGRGRRPRGAALGWHCDSFQAARLGRRCRPRAPPRSSSFKRRHRAAGCSSGRCRRPRLAALECDCDRSQSARRGSRRCQRYGRYRRPQAHNSGISQRKESACDRRARTDAKPMKMALPQSSAQKIDAVLSCPTTLAERGLHPPPRTLVGFRSMFSFRLSPASPPVCRRAAGIATVQNGKDDPKRISGSRGAPAVPRCAITWARREPVALSLTALTPQLSQKLGCLCPLCLVSLLTRVPKIGILWVIFGSSLGQLWNSM